MRSAAEKRLEANADYRLMVSLEELIVDLEEVGKLEQLTRDDADAWSDPQIEPVNDTFEMPTGSRDEVFGQLAAESYLDSEEEFETPAVSFG